MQKSLLLLATVLLTNTSIALADNVNLGNSNSLQITDSSVVMGNSNQLTNTQNTNTMGSGNIMTDSTYTNAMGDSNKVSNTSNSSILGNTNTIDGNGINVIGNNNTVTGDNGIAIGNGNTVTNNSIAMGGATASNGGIAIGSGSVATANNEVNFGDRILTGVATGVADTDAANLGQLNTAAQNTLTEANDYTDSKVPTIINEANHYTDTQYNHAVNELFNKNKGYIDNQVNRLDKKIDNNFQKGNAGIASAMAMASIPKKEGFSTSYGLGVANFRNQQAIALGVEHNTTPRTVVKFTFSTDTKGGTGIGAGFAIGH